MAGNSLARTTYTMFYGWILQLADRSLIRSLTCINSRVVYVRAVFRVRCDSTWHLAAEDRNLTHRYWLSVLGTVLWFFQHAVIFFLMTLTRRDCSVKAYSISRKLYFVTTDLMYVQFRWSKDCIQSVNDWTFFCGTWKENRDLEKCFRNMLRNND